MEYYPYGEGIHGFFRVSLFVTGLLKLLTS